MNQPIRTTFTTLIVGLLLATAFAAPAALAGKGNGNGGGGGDTTDTSLPARIAGLGDSITQSMNSDQLGDQPEHSWSYGDAKRDAVTSHYEQLGNGASYDRFAVSGAKMVDLDAQAQDAVASGAEYVTILMGANDVCTDHPDTMTSVSDFEAQFRQAVDTLTAGAPGTTVYVVSIPDVYHLWATFDGDSSAEWRWGMYNICQSMLSNDRTEEDRQKVRQRNIDFNQVLENVVAETAAAGYDWHWDGNAVFNYAFQPGDVSSIDYFHPSNDGQSVLAQVTWAAGPFA